MTVLFMMLTVFFVMATEAAPCPDTHHCADCNRETGNCLTECENGYYDRQCKSMCSRNCRNNTCVLSEHGSDNCTEGCVPGYSGTGCYIPCDSPGGSCTACPGGCDGGYCPLGSSCMSGCVDSYYGTGCKTCSSGCTSCDGLTGKCNGKPGGDVVGLSVGLFAAAALVVIFLILFWKYGQRWRKNNVAQTRNVLNNVAVEGDASVHELEWYSEIPMTDMVKAYEASGRNCRAGSSTDGVEAEVYDVADERKRGLPAVIDNIYSKLSHSQK